MGKVISSMREVVERMVPRAAGGRLGRWSDAMPAGVGSQQGAKGQLAWHEQELQQVACLFRRPGSLYQAGGELVQPHRV